MGRPPGIRMVGSTYRGSSSSGLCAEVPANSPTGSPGRSQGACPGPRST